MNGKELKRFHEFKKRIIVESTFDSNNLLYGLTREHIEIVLGIPMPMLLESIDSYTRKKILYEQFLFEGVLANLAGGAKTFFKGKAKRIGNLPTNLDQLKEFLTLIFEHPKWLDEFSGHLKDIVDNLASYLSTYFKEIKESTKKTKTKLSEVAATAIQAFESLFEKFSQLKGWSQAALGIGIASVGGFLFNKLKDIVPNIADTLKAGTQGAAVVAIDKPGPVTGSEVTGGGLAAIKIETILHLLTNTIGPKVISAIGNLATGGLYQALAFIASIVGGINNVINAIKPALSATLFFASRDPEQDQGIFTKGADEPKQELEDFEQGLKQSASSPLGRLGSMFRESNNNNQIKLAVLLFEQEQNKSSKKRTEKFVNKVYDNVYPALYQQAKFVIDTMRSGKKPSNKDVVNHITYYMNRYKDINPIVSMDTYGVNMILNYLLKNSKDAGKAKRFYKSMIDAWLKHKV